MGRLAFSGTKKGKCIRVIARATRKQILRRKWKDVEMGLARVESADRRSQLRMAMEKMREARDKRFSAGALTEIWWRVAARRAFLGLKRTCSAERVLENFIKAVARSTRRRHAAVIVIARSVRRFARIAARRRSDASSTLVRWAKGLVLLWKFRR